MAVNKYIILLMSCNQKAYLDEEKACMDTFLKDADAEGVPYYFYRGSDVSGTVVDGHLILVPAPDGLAGTSMKTVLALTAALGLGDWDYLVKTNVSTWLDIRKIQHAVDGWKGPQDHNIYGARFLINRLSRNVPFPRGHFTILSRSLVEGVVKWSPKLLTAEGFPKTDDTLMCLSLLYHIERVLGEKYVEHLREVPSVTSWNPDVCSSSEWTEAMSVRCKDEGTPGNTPANMVLTHSLKSSAAPQKFGRSPAYYETPYGLLQYSAYVRINAFAMKAEKERDKKNPEP